MANQRTNITSPVGRIVMGSFYTPNTTDAEGKPLVIKNGPNAGQPRTNFFFALAIAKGAEQHWAQTPWGQTIWGVGYTAFPQAAQSPTFAWKIEDGDSQVPNKKGRKPCDNEGWKGHWILKFSSGYAPKIYRQEGSGYVQMLDAEAVKPGYYVETAFTVDGNGSQSQPGIYLNHQIVCFRAYGPEIVFGPNVEDAGFGATPLPAGASATPVAGTIPMPVATAAPALPPPPVAATPGAIPPPPGGAVAVTPNPQFLQVPPVPGVAAPSPAANVAPIPGVIASVPPIPIVPSSGVAAPPPPPAGGGPTMTPAAGEVTYQSYKAAGWSDEQLIASGYMIR